MLAVVVVATGFEPTLKLAVVAPAATVTLAGTTPAELLLDNVITTPPLGAGSLIVTVPMDPVPPSTVLGLRTIEVRATEAGVTVNTAVWLDPYVPVMVTFVLAGTVLVLTEKVALIDPAATVTLAGTCADAVLLLESVTVAPFVGAGPLRVTVAIAPDPPTTLVGLTESDVTTIAGPPLPYIA
jgi:hypothetical protein